MHLSDNNIPLTETDMLLSRYISGEASDEERKQVEQWISQAEENRQYAASLQLIWEKTGELAFHGIKDPGTAWVALEKRIDAHPNNVTRLISNRMFRWMTAAASVIILLGWLFLSRSGSRQEPDDVIMIHRYSGAAEQADTLPDQSIVIIKPHSTLSYPSRFALDNRNVELSGSGFFTVHHDASKPFKVNVGDITITVLGTSFDVFSSSDKTSITVRTGIVEVSDIKHRLQLHANEKLVITKGVVNWTRQQDTLIKSVPVENKEIATLKNLPPLTSLPIADKPLPSMLVGDKMPILYIDKWIKGEQVNIFEKGKAYLINFWDIGYGPSIAVLEHLSELQKKYKKDGLVVISATGEDTLGSNYERVSDFIKNMGSKSDHHFAWLPLSYNTSHSNKSIIYNTWLEQANGTINWSLPQVFLVDKTGKFSFIGDGYSLSESYIEKVLKENHDLTMERKNYIDKIRIEYNIDLFVSYLNKKQIAEAVQLGNAIVIHPQSDPRTLFELTDKILTRYKQLHNSDLLQLGFDAASKSVMLTNARSPVCLTMLAKSYSLLNKPEEAVRTIKKAIDLAEGDYKKALIKDLQKYKDEQQKN